jgi:hypothetical protein
MRATGLCLNPLAVGRPIASTKSTPDTRGALTLAVLSVLLVAAVSFAHGQTERLLHRFAGGSDGANPYGRLGPGRDGEPLRLDTKRRPNGTGTVFKLTRIASSARSSRA